jgi:predicted O-methyltransferase YrrM
MVRDAVRFLDRAIRPDWVVLELGSGASTAWFAARAKSVLSFENDPAWHHRVSGPANCRIELASLVDTLLRVQGMPDDSFDLVVVDSNEEPGVGRVDFARAAVSKVHHGGLFVFDDFDREEYRPGDSLFAGWEEHRFVGIKGQPLTTLETSIFRRI